MMLLSLIDWQACSFALFATIAVFFAISVVATSNVVRMAFYLTLSLGATAGLFFIAGAEFVGAMQFMIYVGGTLVLLIFGVMLTAQSNFISMKTVAGEWVLAGVIGSALLLLLVRAGLSVESWRSPRPQREQLTIAETENTGAIGLGLVGIRVDKLQEPNARLQKGYAGYLLPFVIVSMHLLVVLVGAGYMARARQRGSRRDDRFALGEGSLLRGKERRPMPLMIAIGLGKGMVLNVVLALLCWFSTSWLSLIDRQTEFGGWLATSLAASPPWLLPVCGGLFALNVLLIAVAWSWQRWGVIGLAIVPCALAALIAGTPLGAPVAVVVAALLLLPWGALLGLMLQGGSQSVWSRME